MERERGEKRRERSGKMGSQKPEKEIAETWDLKHFLNRK